MLHTMLKKWWVILIQGILLFILGIFIFNNPAEVLAGISLWIGILLMVTGVIGLLGWIFSSSGDRDTWVLIWSLLTAVFGVIVLMNMLAAMKAVTFIFGIWVLITGFNLTSSGWSMKNENGLGWLLFIIGFLSIFAGFMMIFNISAGAVGVATILGIQVLLTGIAMILLSFVKKALSNKVKGKIEELKSSI